MKKYTLSKMLPSALLLVTVGFVASSAMASDADDAKLKELERAMQAPAQSAPATTKKVRTRAIVFDNDPQQQAAVQNEPPKRAADCKDLPQNTPSQAVDFVIQFNAGSSQVSPASIGTLTAIGKILSLSPDRCVFVEGHTDASGNPESNMVLSRDRAESVVNFISTKSGLDSKRLVPIGKGSSDTLKNLTPRDPANRRVVFKVVTG
jgi:outer membrane protein OmpA-like peptidoglycan-associated protein